MKGIIVLLFVTFCNMVIAQNNSDLLRIVPFSDVSEYLMLDGKGVFIKNPSALKDKKERKKLVYINNMPIDSSGLRLFDLRFIDSQLLGRQDYQTFYTISPTGARKIDFQKPISNVVSDLSNFYSIDNESSISLLEFNPPNKKLILNMEGTICSNPPCYGNQENRESVENIFQISNSNYLITCCIIAEGGTSCEYLTYYLYNTNGNKLINVSKLIKDQFGGICSAFERSTIWLKSEDNKFLRGYTNKSSENCDSSIEKSWVVDENLNKICATLAMGKDGDRNLNHPKIVGIEISRSIIKNYYLLSRLDGDKSVIVPYKFIPRLESCMFKIINDEDIAREEIKVMNKYELTILENLLLAKYNYKFNDSFYEAYFNLFKFYNSKSKDRVENVERDLTSKDKLNLQFIRALKVK